MKHRTQRAGAGWILVAGFALVALGLVAESQTPQQGLSTRALPSSPAYATGDSNGSMIAVTGIDVTGGSLLYLVDTEAKQLAVYQATGGTHSTMSVKFVGGRKIDLDLMVHGYNDKSEFSYEKLAEKFAATGTEVPGQDN